MQGAVVIGGHRQFPVRGPGERIERVVFVVRADDALARFDVPNFELFIRAHRSHFRRIRVKGDAVNSGGVFELRNFFARRKIPQLDKLIGAGAGQLLSVGANG